METGNYIVHLKRMFVNKPNEKSSDYQRLSYDLTDQTEASIHEMHLVLKEFSNRSNGEFDYWIQDYDRLKGDPYPIINSFDGLNNESIIYSSELDKL